MEYSRLRCVIERVYIPNIQVLDKGYSPEENLKKNLKKKKLWKGNINKFKRHVYSAFYLPETPITLWKLIYLHNIPVN